MSQSPEEKQPLTPSEDGINEPQKKVTAYDESLFEGSTVFAKPQEESGKKRMKPLIKGLIVSGVTVVLAVAVGVTAFLLPKLDSDSTSSAKDTPSYSLLDIDEDDLVSVSIYNDVEPLELVPVEDEDTDEDEDEDEDESIEWQVKGYESYSLVGASKLVQGTVSLSASKRQNAKSEQKLADDFADAVASLPYGAEKSEEYTNVYGFDRPYAAIVLNEDDESTTVLIGDWSPDESGRYVSVSGDSHVYIINESNFGIGSYSFRTAAADLVDTQVVEACESNDGTADYFVDGVLNYIDTIELSGSHFKNKLVVETAPEDLSAVQYVVTSPAFRACNEDNVANILSVAESGFSAAGAYKLGYTNADLATYGLDKPFTKVAIAIGTYHVTLTFGKEIDGFYPCIVNGSDIIFKVNVDAAEWVAYSDSEIYFDSLFLEYIANIADITVETEEKSATFHLVRESEDDGNDFDVTVEGYDKLNIEADELCYYYARLLALSEEEEANGQASTKEPYLTFTIHYVKSSKSDDVIRLYRYSTRRYLFTLNGSGSSLVSASRVQDLKNCFDALLNGETIGRASY